MAQTIITAGDATSGGIVAAGGNDGTMVLQTGAAGSKVNALAIDAAGNATFYGAVNQPMINNTGAASDVTLAINQQAYIDVSASTSTALKIATADNQMYEVVMMMSGNGNTTGYPILSPNNTTYTNFIYHTGIVEYAGSASYLGDYQSGFPLCRNGDIRQTRAIISTKTTSKSLTYTGASYWGGSGLYWCSAIAVWLSVAANSSAASDTTTAWTSLGTITFPVAATGRIYIKRLA